MSERAGGLGALSASAAEAPGATAWPERLPSEIDLSAAAPGRRLAVYLDAGHGAADNAGNTSSFCVKEQDFTGALADDVEGYLEETGHFHIVRSRVGDQLVAYSSRVEEARRLHADVFVSLHSDVRGRQKSTWSPDGVSACQRATDAPGFSVLWSDEAHDALVSARRELADRVAASLAEAGFVPYGGDEYAGLYEANGTERGVFVDRRAPAKRIFVLRKPVMPSIIVETHNALDPREAERFEDPVVRRAFGLALGAGIMRAVDR